MNANKKKKSFGADIIGDASELPRLRPDQDAIAMPPPPVPAASTSQKQKKPTGMQRELYQLLKDQGLHGEAQNLLGADDSAEYRTPKPQFGRQKVRKWEQQVTTRNGMTMKLWIREDHDPNEKEESTKRYPVVDELTFTAKEYDEHLQSPDWSKETTKQLLEMCARFSLRWPAIHSNFVYDRLDPTKCMDDLKERYYNIFNKLREVQEKECDPVYFDAEGEKKRKEQLEKLMNRSEAEILEEAQLIAAAEQIERRQMEEKKKQEKKSKILQRFAEAGKKKKEPKTWKSKSMHAMSLSNNLPHAKTKKLKVKPPSKKKSLKNKPSGGILKLSNAVLSQLDEPSEADSMCEHLKGAHVRDQRTSLRVDIAKIKEKAVLRAVGELQINVEKRSSERLVKRYACFCSNIVLLHGLKLAEEELRNA